jgi:hypothetical protein
MALLRCLAAGQSERSGDLNPARAVMTRALDQKQFPVVQAFAGPPELGKLGQALHLGSHDCQHYVDRIGIANPYTALDVRILCIHDRR